MTIPLSGIVCGHCWKLSRTFAPDILVLDLMMADMSGIEVTRQVSKSSPRTAIVILSMYGNDDYVVKALRVGAKSYVLKESATTGLVRAVREAAAGRHYLAPPLSERAIEAYIESRDNATVDPYETLTTREREVLHLAAQGLQQCPNSLTNVHQPAYGRGSSR